ncbi:MAG: putative methylthioribose-1-phosphate isomerase, partial [Candidatus Heimdallarchaeota archaeon LC_3]
MEILFHNGQKKDVKAIWFNEPTLEVYFINQRILPYKIEVLTSNTVEKTAEYIKTMVIRGAPSIG